MVRRGWSVMEVPDGWVQVLRGPRPPAVRWPKAEKVSKESSAVQQRERQSGPKWGGRPVPVQQSSGGPSGRWRVGSEPQRVSPDAVRQAARDRVAKLQQALEVLGDISGAEVDGLRCALEKAKKLSSEPTVEVQITECKGFIARAEKRVADLDAQRAQEVAALEEGRARVATSRDRSIVPASRCGDALTHGDNCRVLELTSKLSEGAEHMVEITGGMMS